MHNRAPCACEHLLPWACLGGRGFNSQIIGAADAILPHSLLRLWSRSGTSHWATTPWRLFRKSPYQPSGSCWWVRGHEGLLHNHQPLHQLAWSHPTSRHYHKNLCQSLRSSMDFPFWNAWSHHLRSWSSVHQPFVVRTQPPSWDLGLQNIFLPPSSQQHCLAFPPPVEKLPQGSAARTTLDRWAATWATWYQDILAGRPRLLCLGPCIRHFTPYSRRVPPPRATECASIL